MNINSSIAKAQVFIKENNLKAAILELTDYLISVPTDIEATLLRAFSYLNIGLPKEAIIDYERAFSNPDTLVSLEILYGYSIALYRSGQYDNAIQQLRSILECDENYPEANRIMGKLMMHKKDLVSSINYFSKAITENPNDSDSLVMRAQCLYKLKKYSEAIIDFDKGLKNLQNADSGIYLNYGVCLYNSGNKEDAVVQLKVAHKLGHPKAEEYLKMANAL